PERRGREGKRLLHRGEAFLRVVADPEKLRLVLQVVAEDQAALWIEIRAALGQELEDFVGREDAVLDLRAPGGGRGPHAFGAVRVDQRAQPPGPGFPAGRVELLLAHRLSAPVPNALRREQLDEVRAGLGA